MNKTNKSGQTFNSRNIDIIYKNLGTLSCEKITSEFCFRDPHSSHPHLGVRRGGSQNPCSIHPWNLLESHLGDGQGQVTKNLEGRGAIPTSLALEATFQLAHKQV